MKRLFLIVLGVVISGDAYRLCAQDLQSLLEARAHAWVNQAERLDLVPAVSDEEAKQAPVREPPPSFRVRVPVVQETTTRCRWRPEKEKGSRDLLLCIDAFGPRHREDLPRAQFIVPLTPAFHLLPNRPPIAAVGGSP